MMKLEKWIYFVFFACLGIGDSFTLVEYFRLLRILALKERGNFRRRSQWQHRRNLKAKWSKSGEVMLSVVRPQAWQLRPLCVGEIAECQADAFCESKLLCKSTVISVQCCAPKYRFCPPSKTLGINCNLQKPTNWCDTDFDCHTTPTRRCCPTGCNYNICV